MTTRNITHMNTCLWQLYRTSTPLDNKLANGIDISFEVFWQITAQFMHNAVRIVLQGFFQHCLEDLTLDIIR